MEVEFLMKVEHYTVDMEEGLYSVRKIEHTDTGLYWEVEDLESFLGVEDPERTKAIEAVRRERGEA